MILQNKPHADDSTGQTSFRSFERANLLQMNHRTNLLQMIPQDKSPTDEPTQQTTCRWFHRINLLQMIIQNKPHTDDSTKQISCRWFYRINLIQMILQNKLPTDDSTEQTSCRWFHSNRHPTDDSKPTDESTPPADDSKLPGDKSQGKPLADRKVLWLWIHEGLKLIKCVTSR